MTADLSVITAQTERYITPNRRAVTAVQYTVPGNRTHNTRLYMVFK